MYEKSNVFHYHKIQEVTNALHNVFLCLRPPHWVRVSLRGSPRQQWVITPWRRSLADCYTVGLTTLSRGSPHQHRAFHALAACLTLP